MNDDVVEVKTARDCARRWSHLLEAGAAAVAARSTMLDTTVDDDASSMFDCTDLIVPTSHELINREVELGIRRWHDLASRVIMDDNDGEERRNDDDDDDDEGGTSTTMMMPPRRRENDKLVDATSGGDKRKQRTMPYNFDYACKGNNGGPMMIMTGGGYDNHNGNIHKRPRVISLLDPTKTLDYEDELYHTVFRPIHTLDELEERYALGREKIETHAQVKKKMMTKTTTTTTTVKQRPGRPPNAAATAAASSVATSPLEEKDNTRCSNNDNNDSKNDDNGVSMQLLPHHGCRHTYAVKRNLREWFAKYSRIDAHSLGRLRVRDRHSAPPLLRSNNGSNTATATTTTTYVRFEILRHSQNLKRGSGVDGSRLEVELHGEQRTLLDLHRVIVESALNKEAYGVDSIDNDVDENNTSVVNGIFFIENTFYTCGQVGTHVAEAITCWLDEDSNNEGEGSTTTLLTSRRRKFLGMLPNALLPSVGNSATRIIPMSEIRLEDVSLRLGVRYFHMFIPPPTPSSLHLLFHGHGHDEVDDESSSRKIHSSWSLATESAVFVTGIHTIPLSKSLSKRTDVNNERKDDTIGTKHPILIHDTWAAPQRHICYACNHSPASVVTVNDELTDAAPPGLDDRTNKIYLQGVPLCSSCYRAMHYCRHENTDDGNRGLKLRPSENDHAFLVLSIEEYDRLVTLSSLDDSPANAGF